MEWVYGKKNSKKPYFSSRIIYLPFINAPPSEYDTIYTALLSAIEKCKSLKQEACVITFDQPLYIKARDIVESIGPIPESIKIFIRLGGFHLLMSFMGAIGYIMNGSGLKELFQVAYAPASVEKMLTGHAYARALRAHLLAHAAVAQMVFNEIHFTAEEQEMLEDSLVDITSSMKRRKVLLSRC